MTYAVIAVTLVFRAVYLFFWLLGEIVKGVIGLIQGWKTYMAASAAIAAGVALVFTGHPISGGLSLYHGLAAIFAGLGLIGVRSAIAKLPKESAK